MVGVFGNDIYLSMPRDHSIIEHNTYGQFLKKGYDKSIDADDIVVEFSQGTIKMLEWAKNNRVAKRNSSNWTVSFFSYPTSTNSYKFKHVAIMYALPPKRIR